MLAAVFAAIPIVPPYLVGIFGFVELFLVRGETIAGIIFAITSIAPVMFADKAFYLEIKYYFKKIFMDKRRVFSDYFQN